MNPTIAGDPHAAMPVPFMTQIAHPGGIGKASVCQKTH
jgi:hypothetical protein